MGMASASDANTMWKQAPVAKSSDVPPQIKVGSGSQDRWPSKEREI